MKEKSRIFILTDISTLDALHGEPDDTQSMVRLLLYADEFEIEGLAATYTSHTPKPNPDYIRSLIRSYGKVYETLKKHSPDYPPEEILLKKVMTGREQCGLDQVGLGMDTEASRGIISATDQSCLPLWVLAWGGVTDLAQALWTVRAERSAQEYREFIRKLRVFSISDQYDGCGPWIRKNNPQLFYITSRYAFRGIYRGGNTSLCERNWVERYIKGKGSLGNAYPVYNGNDPFSHLLGKIEGVKEGDSVSFLFLIQNGLNNPDHPEYGSWGGRYLKEEGTRHYYDTSDYWENDCSPWASVFRYRTAFQNDFATRMSRCLKGIEYSLSAPVLTAKTGPEISAPPGKLIDLVCDVQVSDPAQPLTFKWWYYPEAGGYQGPVLIKSVGGPRCKAVIPIPAEKITGPIHIILEAQAGKVLPVTSYQRFILCPEE